MWVSSQRFRTFLRGEMVDDPETVATAIRIGHPQSWDHAWKVHKESGGWFDECSDEEILAAQKLLAEKEASFCDRLQQHQLPAQCAILIRVKSLKIVVLFVL